MSNVIRPDHWNSQAVGSLQICSFEVVKGHWEGCEQDRWFVIGNTSDDGSVVWEDRITPELANAAANELAVEFGVPAQLWPMQA